MSAVTSGYDTLATVDLGSNSFRLQVCRVIDDQLYPLDVLKDTVRLGAGLTADKYLDAATQEKALACLARFGERLRGFLPGQVRIVGTNTLRVARNATEFIERAEKLLGFPIEVVAGREEARLIYLGAAHSLPTTRERRLVIDIGGGSTEFIIGSQYHALTTESLPLGCVRFSLRYFSNGQLTKELFTEASLAARNEIQRIAHDFQPDQWKKAVGTSGTARALRDILALNHYSTADITLAGLERLRDELIACGKVSSLRLNGLKPDRVPVLPGGLAIMLAIFEELNIGTMTVVEGALRDGVLYDLLGRQREKDMRETTVTEFQRRYHVDSEQAQRVSLLAAHLYHMVASTDTLKHPEMLKCLMWAANLHEIGLSISHTAYHKHSAYILQHADMPGFSKREQSDLAAIVLGQRGDMGKMVDYVDDTTLWQAFVALRLAVLFYRSRNAIALPTMLKLSMQSKDFTLWIDRAWFEANPLTAHALEREVTQWRRVGYILTIEVV